MKIKTAQERVEHSQALVGRFAVSLEDAMQDEIYELRAVLAAENARLTELLTERICEFMDDPLYKSCNQMRIKAEAELAALKRQEPVGNVYRYGKDSHGRQWHGIHWYDLNLDVPSGTKLFLAAAPQPQGEVK